MTAAEDRHKEMTMSWLKERDELKKELSTLKRSKEKAENEVDKVQRNLDNAVSYKNPNFVG